MTEALSKPDLSRLIGAIYDCVLEPDRWDEVLAGIMQMLTCRTAILHLDDVGPNRLLMDKSAGVPPGALEYLRTQYGAELAAWASNARASLASLDEPWVASRHMSAADMEASAYYRDVLRPFGIVDVIQYFPLHTATRFSGLALSRDAQQGVITDRELELGGLLLPHIRRAVAINDVLDVRTIERARMAEALDTLRCGVVLTGTDSTILHANRSAEQMLRNGGPIHGTHGALGARTPAAARELREAIRLAGQDETGIGKAGLAVRLAEEDGEPAVAHVLPLTGSELRTRLQPAAVAAVFIGVAAGEERAATMASAFVLTPAETRVLASLLAGRTLAETAAALEVAQTTARTHLDAIFAKTGVSRQADLVRLAGDIVPPTTLGSGR